MTQQQWLRLEELFTLAIELPTLELRESFVQRETASDPELQRQLLAMIAHEHGAAERIGGAIEQMAQSASPGGRWIGRRCGPYRIVREIGRGGMGIVFEAARDDDEYSKRVALKIATSWSDAGLMRERLRNERQILAELEHTNIARFLDGGAEDGVPYIAMEFVEGVPITAHSKTLPLHERILLFRQVCAGVHYAHESLIVHRDLKPANILVTADGVPKLLDFGIAKILGPQASSGATTDVMRLTPDYASPEQVRGRAVTTRSDVYSLGLILYELLCDERAQAADTSSAMALDLSICERDPLPPSHRAAARGEKALSRQLRGDLDTIVAMAIHKEPERRYGSAAALSEDLRRHLAGLPVVARPGGLSYRVGKFVGRHRAGVAAAVLVMASLAAGAISTIHQSRRAERRFEQVRKLANAFVFDVHDRIADLPGSTEARKSIVGTALTYLETLRQDAGNDASLMRELAAAYEKVGDAQGLPSISNLGDTAGALVSYSRAEGLLNSLVARGNGGSARLPLASVYFKLGQVRRVQGDVKHALENFAQSRALCERLLQETPSNGELLTLSGGLYAEMTRTQFELGDIGVATGFAASAMDMAKRLLALDPLDRDHRAGLATSYSSLGTVRLAAGELESAAASYRAAIEIREQLVKEDPHIVSYRRDLMIGYGSLGDVLGARTSENLGDIAGATAAFQKALEIARWLSDRDPADRRAKFDLVAASQRLGALVVDDPQEAPEGLRHLEEAEGILNLLMAEDPKNSRYRYNAAYMDRKMGEALITLNRPREAARRLERAASVASNLLAGPNGPNARTQMIMAKARLAALDGAARNSRALVLAEEVIAEIAKPPSLSAYPWIEAPVSRDLGRTYYGMGRMPEAIVWLEKSRQRLVNLKPPPGLEAKRQTELAAVEVDLAACRRK